MIHAFALSQPSRSLQKILNQVGKITNEPNQISMLNGLKNYSLEVTTDGE